MIKKTFEFKGQMINYFNKVSNNLNIKNAICGLWLDEETNTMKYTVYYWK